MHVNYGRNQVAGSVIKTPNEVNIEKSHKWIKSINLFTNQLHFKINQGPAAHDRSMQVIAQKTHKTQHRNNSVPLIVILTAFM